MADCWICTLKFASNRDLKNHMMPSHGTMRVICPWCPDEKTYKRVTDLRSHVKGAHPHQLAKYPADLISENNAIWFSLDPEGYSRLVKGTEWGSTSATHARVLVLEWISRTRRSTRRKDDWQRGWNDLKKAVLDSGVHPEALTPEGAFQPDYDEEVLDTIMPSIFYTPTAPGIEELEVLNVSLVLGKFCVYVSQGNQTFKIILRDAILSDAKAITSLTRKMSIQKSNTYPQVDSTKLANVTSSTIRSR